MAQYSKSSGIQGGWVDKATVEDGVKVKIVSECVPSESVYQGKVIKNNVAKVRFQGQTDEAKNININWPSINALVEAFGEDSKAWMGQVLTVRKERMLVGGKRVTALYFVPDGFELKEDAGGYLVIERVGAAPAAASAPSAKPKEDTIEYPEEEINPADIPF